MVVSVGGLHPLVGLVEEPPDREPGEVDHVAVVGGVGGELGDLPEMPRSLA